jgi:predicted aspartyl protease
MIRQIALLLFTTVAFSQSKQDIKEAQERRDKYLFAAQANPRKFNASVNFDYVQDELVIPVTINGKTYHFLFDTGAVTIVTPELIAELGLKSVTSNEIVDAAGVKTQQEIYMIDNLNLSNITFSKVSCASMNFDSFSTAFCRKIDGLFGTNIMRLGNWKIDYINHSINFSSEKMKPEFDYNTVEFEHNFSDSPIVSVVTGGIRFKALIDSGNNTYIDLPDTVYKQSKLPKTALSRKSQGRAFFSLGGNNNQEEKAVLSDSLFFGNVLLERQRLRVSPGSQILIGNKFLKQFGEIIISWDKSKIYIPKQTLPLEKEYNYGFTPFIENGKMLVVEIWEGSEAQNKGMSINDIILKVNGLDVRNMSPELWCEFLSKTKDTDALTVEIQKPDGSTKLMRLERLELLKP